MAKPILSSLNNFERNSGFKEYPPVHKEYSATHKEYPHKVDITPMPKNEVETYKIGEKFIPENNKNVIMVSNKSSPQKMIKVVASPDSRDSSFQKDQY